MTFEIQGVNQINLNNLVDIVTERELAIAAREGAREGEAIMAISKEIVPVDDGILRGSADAVGVNVNQSAYRVEVVIGYGGAASAYSIVQHETPPDVYSHAPGKSWKYLERPSLDAVDGMEQRLAAAFRAELEGGV